MIKNIDQICNSMFKMSKKEKKYLLNREELHKSYIDYFNALKYGEDSIPEGKFDVCCVIAFKDRHSIVEKNLQLLQKQTIVPAIVLVVSNKNDVIFALNLKKKYENIFLKIAPNYPIGMKWQEGVFFAKYLNPNALLILGSDDILSLNYIEDGYNKVGKGLGSKVGASDLVGSTKWFIYDLNKNLYKLSYKEKEVGIYLGGGRIYSKYFLDKNNWEIFKKLRNKHLDSEGFDKVKIFSNKYEHISGDEFILSIKGNWSMINSTENILGATKRISWIKENDYKIILEERLNGELLDDLIK
jgi:hypothetical protein